MLVSDCTIQSPAQPTLKPLFVSFFAQHNYCTQHHPMQAYYLPFEIVIRHHAGDTKQVQCEQEDDDPHCA